MITKKLSTRFKNLVTGQAFTRITICFAIAIAWSMAWGSLQIAYGNDAWFIGLSRLRVSDAQEESWLSDGDEPYFIMISFRSRFSTPDSTSTWTNDYDDDDWAAGVDDGNERNISVGIPSMGFTGFVDVQRVSLQNLRRGVMPEILGALVIAMESDSTPWRSIRSMVNNLKNAIEEELERLVEDGELNLLNPGPDIQEAVQNIFDSLAPDFWDIVGAVVESAGDPDDVIGYHLFLYAAVDNTVPVNFPPIANVTSGRLAAQEFSLDSNPIVFRGNGATYRVAALVGIFRIAVLAPGRADYTPETVKPGEKLVKSWGGIKAKY